METLFHLGVASDLRSRLTVKAWPIFKFVLNLADMNLKLT